MHTLLSKMQPITLEQMDRSRLMDRVDTKYVFGMSKLPQLLRMLTGQYRVLEVSNCRSSGYQTLYFDNDDRDCFREHHNGKRNRVKYRMRRYESSELCFFEVKLKDNKKRTCKRRTPLESIDEALPQEAVRFAAEMSSRELALKPQLWTDFARITLVGPGEPERVTIDTDLSFRTGGQSATTPGLVIAEVKQEQDNRDTLIRRRLREMQIRPMRVSKYCLGTALLNPDLKQNKFKQKIRKILCLT